MVTDDVNRKKAKYILVGAFTWPTGGVGEDVEEEVEEEKEDAEIAPRFEDPNGEEEVEEGELRSLHHDERKEDEANSDITEEEQDPSKEEEVIQEAQVKVHRMAIPLPSKHADDILRGIADLYLTLRSEGMYVRQLHSDLAREFKAHGLAKWCMERGVLQTFTSGVDPQANGRAERSVQATKMEVRKMLRAAGVGAELWPLAVRHLNEVWRRDRMGRKEKIPPFMSKVIVKKRYWKAKDFDPKNEVVKYIAPSWLFHGHWIMREDGSKALTRAVITNTQEPVTDEVWIALEDDLNPVDARQRIRGKSLVQRLRVQGEEDEMRNEEKKRQEGLLHEEAARLAFDDVEVAPIVAEGIRMMQEHVEESVEEILQTKIVSPSEVKQKIEKWRKAIEAEIDSLFNIKKALKLVEKEEMKRLMQQGVAPLPSKAIFTLKPDGNNPQGKRKCRIVACGNYAAPEDEANYFAAGADAASLRLVLSLSARKGCEGYNMDVRTAFLNAPWKGEKKFDDSDEEGEQKPVIVRPPGILVTLGYFNAEQGWEVHRALYGFRQSPKLWSDYRDQQLEEMRVGNVFLKQLESESCIWLMKKQEDEEVYGALVTYVDDLLLLAHEELAVLWVKEIQRKWEVSEPEKVEEEHPTRFLGMELNRDQNGHWYAKQEAYTKDLLNRNLGLEQEKWHKRKVPIVREDEAEAEIKEEAGRTPGEVREAQRVVGELIWLVTRCRPDIMYATSLMASLTTRKPQKVMRMAYQVWCYLAGTLQEGLVFQGAANELMVYTDASFGEEDAHGCVVVKWGEDPLSWRSSEQNLMTTSTAEAELVEVMEGAVTAEAIRVMVEEVMNGPVRCWQFTDSSSALTIIIGDTASWRTRHLRKRAKFLRWKALRGDVLMRHQPGIEMVADMGTKPLSAIKLKEHKGRMGMKLQEMEEKAKVVPPKKGGVSVSQERGRLKLALVMALIVRGKAEGGKGEQEEEHREFQSLMVAYTILVVMVTLAIQKAKRYWSTSTTTRSEERWPEEKRPACLEEVDDRSGDRPEHGLTLTKRLEEREGKVKEEVRGRLETRTVEETERSLASDQTKEETITRRSATASSSSKTINLVNETPQRNKMTRTTEDEPRWTPWLVAGNGGRFHRLRHCTGVKLSKNVKEVKLCNACYERDEGRAPGNLTLFARSINHVMHTHRDHYEQNHPGLLPRVFEPCQVCRPVRTE